jgi:hypothetical protein
MKKIFNLFIVLVLLFSYSCNDNEDFNTDDLFDSAIEGGAIVAVNKATEGKLLGVPSSQDFENATISFAEASLTMSVLYQSGGDGVERYELVKSLNGGTEALVTSSTTLPLSVTYDSVDQYIEGLGVTENDLRIGDVISFRTKIVKTDGSANYSNEGTYNVTVSCSSNLAGLYDVRIRYVRTASGIDAWYEFQDEISATGVGEYRTSTVGIWEAGDLPGVPGYTFTDLCGALDIPEQNLAEYYSNIVLGSGSVDGATGVLTFEYTICATDCREYTATYTPVN